MSKATGTVPAGTIPAGAAADEAATLAGCRFLRTFDGIEPTADIVAAIHEGRTSGVTLFRSRNIGSPGDVRALCAALQAARPAGDPPLVIGLDQEGGQLQAVGHGATAWPGALALGAARSAELARAAGAAIGAEAAAMGATLVLAPVCDVLGRASATPLGTRSFGSDPALVAALATAMTEGLQAAGVAATLKHFPGHGAASGDSHEALPVIRDEADLIRSRDLPPFAAGIAAGASAVMPGHLAAPALTDGRSEAATVSRTLLEDILRAELGFAGVTISDALDMGGAGDAGDLEGTVVRAAEAGIDLLLLAHGAAVEDAAAEALARAIRSGRHDPDRAGAARDRILRLRARFGRIVPPPLDVVGCDAHQALARRIAEGAVTLVRDPTGLLPLRPGSAGRVARAVVLAPVPVDLTPAETSSHLRVGLAEALRERGLAAGELVMPLDPSPAEIAALVGAAAAATADVAVVGTFDALSHPGQATLVAALARRQPTVAVALRSPYDAGLFTPDATVACSYGIQAPQIAALADALLGRIPFAGRLPVTLEGTSGAGDPGAEVAR